MNVLFRFCIIALFCSSSLLHGMQDEDRRYIKKKKTGCKSEFKEREVKEKEANAAESEEKMKKDLLAYRDGDGNTIVHQLAKSNKNFEAVEALFKKSGDFKQLLKVKNAAGLLPLAVAVLHEAVRVGACFIDHGASRVHGIFQPRFLENRSLLHRLVIGNKNIGVGFVMAVFKDMKRSMGIQAIIDDCWNLINHCDSFGKTALHYACELGREKIVSRLLSTKISDIGQLDNNHEIALHLALRRNDFTGKQIARMLIKQFFFVLTSTSIPEEAHLGHETIQSLLVLPNRDGVTPLQVMPSLEQELRFHIDDLVFRDTNRLIQLLVEDVA